MTIYLPQKSNYKTNSFINLVDTLSCHLNANIILSVPDEGYSKNGRAY